MGAGAGGGGGGHHCRRALTVQDLALNALQLLPQPPRVLLER